MPTSTTRFVSLRDILLASIAMLPNAVMSSKDTRPMAFVYNGKASCNGCPDSFGDMLTKSPWNFNVIYGNPAQPNQLDEKTLSKIKVFAYGGGPDVDVAYNELKKFAPRLQKFVSSGGIYMGICLGAYLAGNSDDFPGFDLLPPGVNVVSEIQQKGAEITNDKDNVTRLDWKFQSGKIKTNLWAYFQEGAAITGLNKYFKNGGKGRVVANYSKNDDVVASVTPYGNGWVGIIGTHPEADKSWYTMEKISNPDGYSYDMGFDFINATLSAAGTHS